MKILVINAGSSSLKYQLFDMDDESVIAKGLIERIGIDGSNLKHQPAGKEAVKIEQPIENHVVAARMVLEALVDPQHGVIKSMDEIGAVGHRVLHGGEAFTKSVIIDDAAMQAIRDNIDLGPLHNPANIMGIEACQVNMPTKPNVAVFDTTFHQTMPPKAFIYAIPYEYYTKLKVRRYGFHGTSHNYVSHATADFLGKNIEDLRIITCHLGNGSSIAAVKYGKVVDTSMGLTPLEGLVMGTRSGDLDPAILEYVMNKEDIDIGEMVSILNKKSGLLGVSGKSSDMRDIESFCDKGDERSILAREMLIYRIKKYIGSYAAAMGGVDVIVFTAGIGENNGALRADVMADMEFLGASIDAEKNKQKSDALDISAEGSKVRTLVIATNEELMIARDCLRLVTQQ